MSLLCKNDNKMNLLISHKRPSPTCNNHISRFAQSKLPHRERNHLVYPRICRFIKGISLLTSFGHSVVGSMTVEASIVLPLFLFFFLNLGGAIEMIRLHGNLQLSLWEAGNRLAVYGHILDNENEMQTELLGIALSYTYVKSQIIDYLGKEYLESSPLSYGADGLQFVESNFRESDGRFELVLTYSVSPVSSMAGLASFQMANCYYGHMWNGYQISGAGESKTEQYVYLTENAGVYHTDRNCTHLVLSVRQVSLPEAYQYDACQKCCKRGYQGSCYITNEGDCYHYDRECPGLKRTVYCVAVSEVDGLRICQRCGS